MRAERVGTLAVVGSAAGFGFLSILLKLALEAGAGALPLVAWRFAIAVLVMLPLLGVGRRRWPDRRALPGLVALGAVYAVDAVAFTLALRTVPASTAVLVFFTYPALVVLLAALTIGERITPHRAVAIVLTVAGCALTAGGEVAGGDPAGIGLVLLATLGLAIYMVAGRRLLAEQPSRGSAVVMLATTAAVATAAAAPLGGLALGGGARALALAALAATVSTAIPITLLVVGLQRIAAGRAAITSTIEPIVAVTAAAAILGERIGPAQIVGGGMILAGVVWLRLEPPARRAPRGPMPTP